MATADDRRPTDIRLLIAEDSPTQSRRLVHILEQRGWQVRATAATSGTTAAASTYAASILRLRGADQRHHQRDRRDRAQNFKVDHFY